MARKKRGCPEINSSSTADMAFLLLIFFLITTSMDTDRGLARRLPEPPQENQKKEDKDIKERNILQVFVNFNDQLMCGSDYVSVEQLRDKAKEIHCQSVQRRKVAGKSGCRSSFLWNPDGDKIPRYLFAL